MRIEPGLHQRVYIVVELGYKNAGESWRPHRPPARLGKRRRRPRHRWQDEEVGERGLRYFHSTFVCGIRWRYHKIVKEFKTSVDVYLEMCKKHGKEPDKPFSGKFVLRIEPGLHQRVYIAAKWEEGSVIWWK